MIEVRFLDSILSPFGYRRLRNFTYRATWSTEEVEHFIYFSVYGTPKEYLSAYFGIRNSGAEKFSFDCVTSFGGLIYSNLRHNMQSDCFMRFSIGRLANWTPRESLSLKVPLAYELGNVLSASIEGRLLPEIRGVNNVASLLSVLVSDVEPWSWFRTNGAIRVAQIAYLARRTEMSTPSIIELLQQLRDKWASALRREITSESFAQNIMARLDGYPRH